MELINLMLKYYVNTGIRSFKHAIRNWMVSLLLIVYSVVLFGVALITARLPLVGGIILAAATAACSGSYLYLVQTIINSRLVNVNDLKNSFTPYLRKIINVTFYIWIAMLLYSYIIQRVIQGIPNGWIISILIYLAAFVILNPLPEVIYQTYSSELGIFKASLDFMKENFIEWIIPNIVLSTVLYFLLENGLMAFFGLNIIYLVKYIIGLFVFLFAMIYRGILFRFLNESTRRSRLFKLRMLKR